MKNIIIHLLSYSVTILALAGCQTSQKHHSNQTMPKFKAGETVTLIDGLKIYAESVTSTNLQNVTIYECDESDQLTPTIRAEHADYSMSDEEGIRLMLHNAIIEAKDTNGQPITIEAKSFPIVLGKKISFGAG